ncbi:MAG: hypothetical protein SXQ77_08570 [Halobacteria archaeon]|nr:hypothetical protein [Halobacteria archaeon]
MDVEERISEAEDNLEDWIRNAVNKTQEEMFKGDSAQLEKEEIMAINKIDKALKKEGRQGIWGSVQYSVYTEEDEDGDPTLKLDTFGVPIIPSDLSDVSVSIDEERRERFNNVLSEYGVKVSERIQEQFDEWVDDSDSN